MTATELRAAMRRLGLRQIELVRRLGVCRQTVHRWRCGELEVPRYVCAYLELAERCASVGIWDLSESALFAGWTGEMIANHFGQSKTLAEIEAITGRT